MRLHRMARILAIGIVILAAPVIYLSVPDSSPNARTVRAVATNVRTALPALVPDAGLVSVIETVEAERLEAERLEAERLEAERAAADAARSQAQSRASSPVASREPSYRPTGSELAECIKKYESGGNYASSSNPNYRGAYQFSQSTWNNTVRSQGREDLVGVDPATASPEDQDDAFWYLWGNGSGARHWEVAPRCGY